MESAEHAQLAIKELNEQPLEDQNLRINLALERSERGSSNGGEREKETIIEILEAEIIKDLIVQDITKRTSY